MGRYFGSKATSGLCQPIIALVSSDVRFDVFESFDWSLL
jgi:hypothetical protein